MRLRRLLTVLLMLIFLVAGTQWPVYAQILSPIGPGPTNSITDVQGIQAGHWTNASATSGVTIIHAPDQAIGGVDVRGGWPGTVETDLLDPRNLVQKLNAVVIVGGSVFGIDARNGVMRCLEERQEGYSVGVSPAEIVPIVPGAIIHDLPRIAGGQRPGAESGYQACQSASGSAPAQGNVGAGAGAVSGGIKGGFGTASTSLQNGVLVGAAVVVNTYGRSWRPDTCELYAGFIQLGEEYGNYKAPSAEECDRAGQTTLIGPGSAVAVVATNFALSKAQAQKMAGIGQDGLARVIRPSHTSFDGDVVFALSTGTVEAVGECQAHTPHLLPIVCALVLNDLLAAAADTVSRAANHALLKAASTPEYKSYCDTFPSACAATSAQSKNVTLVGGVSARSSSPVRGDTHRPLILTTLLLMLSAVLFRHLIKSRNSKGDLPEEPAIATSHREGG